jgi:hypothetical protein
MNHKQQATMTTLEGKPTPVLRKLSGIDGVYVQCRIASGEDVYVPLREVCEMFVKELTLAGDEAERST